MKSPHTDVSDSFLGALAPEDALHLLPRHVRILMTEAGYDPAHFTRGELDEIIHACADGVLVENHDAPNDRSKKSLQAKMQAAIGKIAEERGIKPETFCTKPHATAHVHDSFCDRLEEAREESPSHGHHE